MFEHAIRLPVDLRVDGEPEVELSLFRVAQEALANAWKQAQAPLAIPLQDSETVRQRIEQIPNL